MKIKYKICLILCLCSTSILIPFLINYEYNYYKTIKGVYSDKIDMIFLNPSVVHIFNNDNTSKTIYIGCGPIKNYHNNELNYTIQPKNFKEFYIYGSFDVYFYYYDLDDFQYFDFEYISIAGMNWEEDEAIYYTYVISWSPYCSFKYSEEIWFRSIYNHFGTFLIAGLIISVFIVFISPEKIQKNLKRVSTNEST